MLHVNRTQIDQGVHGPGFHTIWLRPGEAVSGAYFDDHSHPDGKGSLTRHESLEDAPPHVIEAKVDANGKVIQPERAVPIRVVAHHENQTSAAIARRLAEDPALDALVKAKRAELEDLTRKVEALKRKTPEVPATPAAK